jgi:hypothetical protein
MYASLPTASNRDFILSNGGIHILLEVASENRTSVDVMRAVTGALHCWVVVPHCARVCGKC